MLKQIFWRGLTIVFLSIAIVGAILPGIPTTEFLLLAVWSSSQGWPSMHRWLIYHPKYGPVMQQWKNHKIIPRKAKVFSVVTMSVSAYLLIFSGITLWLKLSIVSVMVVVLLWLISRPERVRANSQQT